MGVSQNVFFLLFVWVSFFFFLEEYKLSISKLKQSNQVLNHLHLSCLLLIPFWHLSFLLHSIFSYAFFYIYRVSQNLWSNAGLVRHYYHKLNELLVAQDYWHMQNSCLAGRFLDWLKTAVLVWKFYWDLQSPGNSHRHFKQVTWGVQMLKKSLTAALSVDI